MVTSATVTIKVKNVTIAQRPSDNEKNNKLKSIRITWNYCIWVPWEKWIFFPSYFYFFLFGLILYFSLLWIEWSHWNDVARDLVSCLVLSAITQENLPQDSFFFLPFSLSIEFERIKSVCLAIVVNAVSHLSLPMIRRFQ